MFALGAAGVLVFSAIGCGGGSGAAASGGSGSSALSVFFTDNLSAGYDAVWVTVHKVEVSGPAGSVTVLDSPAGEAVDLRALGSPAGGRFLFIAPGALPTGTYNKIEVLMGRALTLYPTGATTGTAATFAPVLNSGDKSKLELPLAPPITSSGAGIDLVVDFDLAAWTLAGGIVTPVVRRHNGQGLDDLNRHERGRYEGRVTSLAGAAPNQTFLLQRGARTLPVTTNSTTVIFSRGGTTPPALANGQEVHVGGVFDVITRSLTAKEVRVDDRPDGGVDDQEIKGKVTEANASAGTMKIATRFVMGFVPAANPVNITTTAATSYLSNRGLAITKAAFFEAIATAGANAMAEAEGVYDRASNTLAARKLKLETENDGGALEAEARGISSLLNPAAGTFTINVAGGEIFGFTPPAGGDVKVTTSDRTMFKNKDGETVSRARFFELAVNGDTIKVNGAYNTGAQTLAARKAELRR